MVLSGMQDAVVTAIREAETWIEQGQAATAIARLQQVVEQLERESDPDPREMATLYDRLGLASRADVQLSFALASFMRAYEYTLPFAEYDRLSAEISMHFGELCLLHGLLADAVTHLGDAYEFFDDDSDPQHQVMTLLQAGLTYEAMEDVKVAKKFYFRALSICQTEHLPTLTRDVRQQYAFSVLGQQDVQSAEEELIRCADAYRAAGDVGGEAQTYARIGAVYLQHNRMEEAGQALEQALSLFTAEIAARDPRLPEVYHVQAKYSLKLRKYEQAIDYSERAGEAYAKMGLEKASVDAWEISVQAYQQLQSRNSMKRAMDLLNQDGSLDPW